MAMLLIGCVLEAVAFVLARRHLEAGPRVRALVDRHGMVLVFAGCFVAGARLVVAAVAGASGMEPRRFAVAATAGIVGWVPAAALADAFVEPPVAVAVALAGAAVALGASRLGDTAGSAKPKALANATSTCTAGVRRAGPPARLGTRRPAHHRRHR